ncbi:F-box/LRR-repeat protein At3g03360 isoform X1 [Capsicum annuum]|uniref:F-box/LRR-repeat protein At3g03360 isoform X1 n=1 Tax=Capsicum annuum TaxID=4072 RepID=UPI001FB16DA0|nr:F-box/LRR-repeat protein At3g03360 isoform X1 [Capsicum annuum]
MFVAPKKILSGCPALETLELCAFDGFRRLEITSSNLKRLTLDRYWWFYGRADEPLVIIAPHLQHLEFLGDFEYLKCRLVNVSSLVSARLTLNCTCVTEIAGADEVDGCADYHQDFRKLVLDYFQKLSNATELTIGRWLAEVVFMLQLKGVSLPKLRCRCLTLEMYVTKYNLYGVASLLQNLPLLETLNIDLRARAVISLNLFFAFNIFDFIHFKTSPPRKGRLGVTVKVAAMCGNNLMQKRNVRLCAIDPCGPALPCILYIARALVQQAALFLLRSPDSQPD